MGEWDNQALENRSGQGRDKIRSIMSADVIERKTAIKDGMAAECGNPSPVSASTAPYQEIFKPVMWEKNAHEGRGVMWDTVKKELKL